MTNTEIIVALARWSHDPALGDRAQVALRRAARRLLGEETSLLERAATGTLTELSLVGSFTARVILQVIQGARPPEPPVADWPEAARSAYEATEQARSHYLALADARLIARDAEWPPPCGDLQMHTLWSDGAGSPAQMAEAGSRLGYEFIAITDHTAGLRIARGMSPERIRLQREEIARLPSPPLRIFAGVEANVAPSGELDVTAQDLAGTEIVLAGCHAALRRAEDQTPRLVAAVSHPTVHCLAHPRGRVFNLPRGIRARWDEVFEAAAAHGTAVEVNAFPDRQDLDASLLPAAAQAGCLISLGTDSHSPRQLPLIDIALAQLVRSGVQRDQVLNYWSAETLAAWLRRKP